MTERRGVSEAVSGIGMRGVIDCAEKLRMA